MINGSYQALQTMACKADKLLPGGVSAGKSFVLVFENSYEEIGAGCCELTVHVHFLQPDGKLKATHYISTAPASPCS